MRAWLVLLPLTASACGAFNDPAPNTPQPIPPVCEDAVYNDPAVKDLIAKSAGSEQFRISHIDQLKYAKIDAQRRCEQQKGILPPGGGVERPRLPATGL